MLKDSVKPSYEWLKVQPHKNTLLIDKKAFKGFGSKASKDGLEIILEERKVPSSESLDSDDVKAFPTKQNPKIIRDSYEILETTAHESQSSHLEGSQSFYQPSTSIYTTFLPEFKEENLQRTRSMTLSKLNTLPDKEDSSESDPEFSLNLSGDALPIEEPIIEQKFPESNQPEDPDSSRTRSNTIEKPDYKLPQNDASKNTHSFGQKVPFSFSSENPILRQNTENISAKEELSKSLSTRTFERTLTANLQDFNKSFGTPSPSPHLLKQGPLSPKPSGGSQQKIQSNPLRQCCRYDYKIVTKDNGTKPSLNASDVRVERVVILDDAKILKFVSNLEHEAVEKSISDCSKLEEHYSDEPYIVFKKGDSSLASSPFTTDIQQIDLNKLLNLHCEFKILRNVKTHQASEERRKKLLHIFLLSHDLFCSSVELLIEFIKRFFIPFPSNITKSEMKEYETMIRTPTQYVVLDVIADWLEVRGRDFHENKYLGKLLEIFVRYSCESDTLLPVSESVQKGLKLLLNYKNLSCSSFVGASNEETLKSKPNLKVIPETSEMTYNIRSEMDIEVATNYFLQYTAKQLAHQLTRIDHRNLKSIRIRNLPHNINPFMMRWPLWWPPRHERIKNVEDFLHDESQASVVSHTNHLTFMMVYTIIAQAKPKKRIELISKLTEIASKLLAINNFHSFSCIMGAIMNIATQIQAKTSTGSAAQGIKRSTQFEELFSSNASFRNKINQAELPKIPCIMIINEDLTKLVGMHHPYMELDTKKLLNFKLMEESASVIYSLISAQKSVYDDLEQIPELEAFLLEFPIKMMKKLDPELSFSNIQTKLMNLAQKNLRFSGP